MQKLHGISNFLPVIVIEDHKALGSSITINCLRVVVTKAGFVLCAIIETVGVGGNGHWISEVEKGSSALYHTIYFQSKWGMI
ncbi:hypothetical protein WN944_015805 [Citrus x changshan-huyou]|uniref:Uncharacterized protein n=1 Tax=Citrus x changshan-huyou TaxID=2935761 RepID=A0AAP0LKB9_9ROSI